MMESLERRALYNLIKMNRKSDPSLAVEDWQIEDYRALSTPSILKRLQSHELVFDSHAFIQFTEDFDSPEEMSDQLLADRELSPSEEDQIYLLIFELWRRLLPDQPSISIICDALDQLIFAYDEGVVESPVELEDAISSVIQVLDENVDQGLSPHEVFEKISLYFANDLRVFLYDFITDQFDDSNRSYAEDLMESLDAYLSKDKWFSLLRYRGYGSDRTQMGRNILQNIFDDYLSENDLEFNLELLSLLVDSKSQALYFQLANQTIPLLKTEEQLEDFLGIVVDFAKNSSLEPLKNEIQAIRKGRKKRPQEAPVFHNDQELTHIVKLLTT